MRIGILGMGGVGSFIGAQLAKNYLHDAATSIVFICRGKTKAAILEKGLTLITKAGACQVMPDLVSDDAAAIGKLDILLVCTKSYALEKAVHDYEGCLDQSTVVIPLQNMVNAREHMQARLSSPAKVLAGCIYVASNISEPGTVNHVGGPGKILFGSDNGEDFQWVAEVLVKGGIDATYTTDINKALWKKYLFVSPVAALTAGYQLSFGQLAADSTRLADLEKMMREVQALGNHAGVELKDQDVQEALAMLHNFPYEAKSSLQLDFENGQARTEQNQLVDYVIESGARSNINVDAYKKVKDRIRALYPAWP